MAALHALERQIVPGLQGKMHMRHHPRLAGDQLEQQTVDLHLVKGKTFVRECFQDIRSHTATGLRPRLLAANLVSGAQRLFSQTIDLGDEGFVLGRRSPIPCRLAGFTHQFVDRCDGDIALLMTEYNGTQHHFFRQAIGLGLDHQHSGFGASDDQIHLASKQNSLAWIQYIFAVDIANASRTNRATERDAGDSQGG